MQYDNYLFCYFYSMIIIWFEPIKYVLTLVIIKWLTHLHISILYCSRLSFSKHTPSSSCVRPVAAFHCRLCPLALLFGRENPGSQAFPLILSFRQHHVVPGSHFSRAAQVSFGSITTWCPRGSWDTCHVCPHPGLSAITRWNRLLKIERICHLEFQSRRGSKY